MRRCHAYIILVNKSHNNAVITNDFFLLVYVMMLFVLYILHDIVYYYGILGGGRDPSAPPPPVCNPAFPFSSRHNQDWGGGQICTGYQPSRPVVRSDSDSGGEIACYICRQQQTMIGGGREETHRVELCMICTCI